MESEPNPLVDFLGFMFEIGKIAISAPKQDASNEEQSKEAAFKIINKSVEVCLVPSKYFQFYIINYHHRSGFLRSKNVKSRFNKCWIDH